MLHNCTILFNKDLLFGARYFLYLFSWWKHCPFMTKSASVDNRSSKMLRNKGDVVRKPSKTLYQGNPWSHYCAEKMRSNSSRHSVLNNVTVLGCCHLDHLHVVILEGGDHIAAAFEEIQGNSNFSFTGNRKVEISENRQLPSKCYIWFLFLRGASCGEHGPFLPNMIRNGSVERIVTLALEAEEWAGTVSRWERRYTAPNRAMYYLIWWGLGNLDYPILTISWVTVQTSFHLVTPRTNCSVSSPSLLRCKLRTR